MELSQERRPNKIATQAASLYLHRVGNAGQNLGVNGGQIRCACLASQGINLDATRIFKCVHLQKSICNCFAHGEQAMVAQHQIIGASQVFLQAQLFIVTNRNAFITMIGQRG